MSSTSAMTMAMASGSYSAGAMIPFTATFIDNGATTAVAVVGQVLDSGATNFVGYEAGDAEYLLTASAANAQQTTLADGRTYYISSGARPSGYLALASGAMTDTAGASGTGMGASGAAETTGSMTESSPMTTGSRTSGSMRASSSTASAMSATSTSQAAGRQFSMGGAVALALGFVALTVGYLA